MNGRTPYELVTSRMPDISEYVEYEWYEPLWFYNQGDFPEERCALGRWLGVAHRVGQACCYYIRPVSGMPIVCSTVQKVSKDEKKSTLFQEQLASFDTAIEIKLGQADLPDLPNEFLINEDDGPYDPVNPEAEMPEADSFDSEMYDQYISAEIMVPRDDTLVSAKVIGMHASVAAVVVANLPFKLFHHNYYLTISILNLINCNSTEFK
jgi:hypothetical protein